MCRTGKDDLLIEMLGGTDSAEPVRAEVLRSLGPETKVRMLASMALVEIQDMDEDTSKEEVLSAVPAFAGNNTARVVNIRKTFGGAQTAVIILHFRYGEATLRGR